MGFAYCFPYTFTDLKEKIEKWEERKYSYLTVSKVGRSLLSSPLYCLTITSNDSSMGSKQTIVLTARMHAGETLSSYILEQLVERLLANTF